MTTRTLFEINPDLDRAALAKRFAQTGRVQVRDVLTREAAEEIQSILMKGTPWGMAVRAGDSPDTPPRGFSNAEIMAPGGADQVNRMANAAAQATARGDYGFRYAQFSLVEALQKGFNPGGPHELLLEHINADPFMELVREITGFDTLAKADDAEPLPFVEMRKHQWDMFQPILVCRCNGCCHDGSLHGSKNVVDDP